MKLETHAQGAAANGQQQQPYYMAPPPPGYYPYAPPPVREEPAAGLPWFVWVGVGMVGAFLFGKVR